MFEEIEKIARFVRRDMVIFTSYKMSVLLSVLATILGALSYAFLGANASMQAVIQAYNMSLLTYLAIGMAFSTYFNTCLTAIERSMNPNWLEEVLASPTKLSTFVIGSSAWGLIWSAFVAIIYLAISVVFFGISLSINLAGFLIVLLLGTGAFIGFSLVGSGILILTKQGNPVAFFFTIISGLFGNVLFPPQILPHPLELIAYVTPQYYFFTDIRLMLVGWPLSAIVQDVLALMVMFAVILPLGYFVFQKCLYISRKNGNLSWY